MKRRFDQIDVFTAEPLARQPAGRGARRRAAWTTSAMAAFARWTNLSETTFLLPPTDAQADYRVRIFTPGGELPFAGHPTLGSCHAWLAAGGRPRDAGMVVQQCGVGLVRVRAAAARHAWPLPRRRCAAAGRWTRRCWRRSCAACGLPQGAVRAHQWVDNGPGWCAVLLDSAERVLALQPDWPTLGDLKLGVVGAAGRRAATRSSRCAPSIGDGAYEDPVTGSLNASLAQWLIGAGLAPPRYVAAQGAALRRAGRVHIEAVGDDIWVGGDVTPLHQRRGGCCDD